MKRALLWCCLASCAAPPPDPPTPAPPPIPTEAEVREVIRTLDRSFSLHWGSLERTDAYRTLDARHVPLLRRIADANGEGALTAMRILDRLAPDEEFTDDARALIYTRAFSRESNFGAWGVMSGTGFLPGVYGRELLDLGRAAVKPLQRHLTDGRRARVYGGTGEALNRRNGDRVCDYAWVFLATILDRPVLYDADPRRRDPHIRALDLWIDRNFRT